MSNIETKPGFLGYLHSFRGFAILCVVAVHAGVMPIVAFYGFGEPDKTDPLFIANEALFHASTIYFALISGLLYAAVLEKKGFKHFFRSKFLYVFLPYLFFTLLLSLGRSPEGPDDQGGIHTNLLEYLAAVGRNLLFGKAMPIFWYLPVLFCLYALTPFYKWIMKIEGAGKWLIAPIIIAPLFISRQPIANDYSFFWEDVVFFAGVYAAGMLVGFNVDAVVNWIQEKMAYILGMAVLSLGGIVFFYANRIDVFGITSLPESFHYLNKLAISGIMLVLFKRLDKQPKLLTSMANDAFAIYFIHFIPIYLVLSLLIPFIQNEAYYPYSILVSIPVVFAGSLAITKGLIFLLKKLLRKYSRLVIGS